MRLVVRAAALLLPVIGTRTDAAELRGFRVGILPILTKAGCNSGACHGASTGQGGFRLSLLGYDALEDHLAITRDLRGRRIDTEKPERSLFLRKPLRDIAHRGGRRIDPGSDAHRALEAWIAAGAPYGPEDLRVARIEASPASALLAEGESISIRVTAILSDGAREDATALALYDSNDDAIAEVDGQGRVRALRPGVTSIRVRFGGEVEAVRIAVPYPADPSSEAAFAAFLPRGFIDELVLAELKRLNLPPSRESDDAEFLRRAHLDLTGRLPSSAEARAFLDEPPSDAKRDRLVDRLVESEGFNDLWTHRLAELFLSGGKRASDAIAAAEHAWIRDQVVRRTPLDRVARELITAEGDATRVGPAGFLLLASDPRDLAEIASGVFLATRIGCARCHAHPADRWTQADHIALAACFAKVERDGSVVRVRGDGAIDDPRSGKPAEPRPPGGTFREAIPAGTDPRRALADWVTAPENRLFARALVNRAWKHLMGRGLVEPAGDLRPTNPATNPGLLDALAADFVSGGHDLRRLVRTIARSRAYRLSCRATPANRLDDRLFSRAYPKPLGAELLLDALSAATGVPERFPGHPDGTLAVELPSARTPSLALDILGRCSRDTSCDAAGSTGGGIAQALHLLNGATIAEKVRGVLAGSLAELPAKEAITELYLRCFSRYPDPEEIAHGEQVIDAAGARGQAIEDLLWALLNSREFAFNH